MAEIEQIQSLIGDVYDAALDPSRWSGALLKARDFVGGSTAAVYSKNARAKSGMVFYYGGDIEPHYVQLYFDKCVKFDPSTTAHVLAEIEQPICIGDIMPHDEFEETRFY